MLKNDFFQRNINISFSPLSPENGFLLLNTGDFVIRALCSDHAICKCRCKQNGKYKSISTHITYSIGAQKNQLDPCSAHVRTVTRDVAWWLHNVMWRFCWR